MGSHTVYTNFLVISEAYFGERICVHDNNFTLNKKITFLCKSNKTSMEIVPFFFNRCLYHRTLIAGNLFTVNCQVVQEPQAITSVISLLINYNILWQQSFHSLYRMFQIKDVENAIETGI